MHINVNRYQRYDRQIKTERKRRKQVDQPSSLTENTSLERILKRNYILLEGTEEEMAEQLDRLRFNISRRKHPVGHFVDIWV